MRSKVIMKNIIIKILICGSAAAFHFWIAYILLLRSYGFVAVAFALIFMIAGIIAMLSICSDRVLNWIDSYSITDILLFRQKKETT